MKWTDTPYLRIGVAAPPAPPVFIVSKKIHKHAVVRHRYQRLMREVFRVLPPAITEKYAMVWVAKPEILTVKKLPELKASLAAYLAQL